MPALGPLAAAGAGLDIATGLYGFFHGLNQNRQGRQMIQSAGNRPQYQIPGVVGQQLATRQLQLNAPQAGQEDATQLILGNQAGTIYNDRQASTNSSQLLGSIGTAQANTNQALLAQGVQNQGLYQQRLAGLENAQNNMAAQEQYKYGQNLDAYNQKLQIGYGLQGVGQQLSNTAGNLYKAEEDNGAVSLLFKQMMGSRNRAPQMPGMNFSFGNPYGN
jgi:hypothetical protein